MERLKINVVYFSATHTTRKVVRTIAEQFIGEKKEYNITQQVIEGEVWLTENDLLIVGIPVYSGRIPAQALISLNRIKANHTSAIIVCVYGNRDYDDALLELKEVVESNGFTVISAGAFVAQHSIFPKVGQNRPDEKDIFKIKEFAIQSVQLLESITKLSSVQAFEVKGNKPYKVPGKIPLYPKGDKRCDECGTCVKMCPTEAISKHNPRKTDKDKCIACGRCIVVCPQQARSFGGLLYKLARKKFIKSNSERKEPSVFFSNLEK